MKKVVVVGSLNLDLVASVPRMPALGETLTGQDFATYPGGKGANQAVAAARLGGETVMIGRLGDDAFGQRLHAALADEDIATHCVEKIAGASGSAIIMVTPEGYNSIVVMPGANYGLKPEDLEIYREEFKEAAVVLAQLEIPLETVIRLGEMAAEIGVPFVLDPAPARELPAELLKNVTWLTPNESETKILLKSLGSHSEVSRHSLDAIAKELLSTGVRNVALKLGADGAFLAGRDVEPVLLPSFTVNAVDTTAAGDAFNGGFCVCSGEGNDAGPSSALCVRGSGHLRYEARCSAVHAESTGGRALITSLAIGLVFQFNLFRALCTLGCLPLARLRM